MLPAAVVAALDGVPTTDFAALVAALAERFPVETLEAPAEARRVADDADLRVLEALTAPVRAPSPPSTGRSLSGGEPRDVVRRPCRSVEPGRERACRRRRGRSAGASNGEDLSDLALAVDRPPSGTGRS